MVLRYTEMEWALKTRGDVTALSEKQWQAMVTKALTATGWLWYHTHDSRKSQKGFPDIVAVRPPHVLYIECKAETGVLTPDQRVWRDWLLQCPQIEYYVWRPSDYAEVTARLQRKDMAHMM